MDLYASANRDERQEQMRAWVTRNWGDKAMNRVERVERLLEEVIELAQAEGLPLDALTRISRHVYHKPPGEPAQEVGGIATCLLAYCAGTGISADAAEAAELQRILVLSPQHFRARHAAKVAAGMATAYPSADGLVTPPVEVNVGVDLLGWKNPSVSSKT